MWTIQLNDDEYKVLVKWLSKEPYPSENNFPHIHSALNKLLNANEGNIEESTNDVVKLKEKLENNKKTIEMLTDACNTFRQQKIQGARLLTFCQEESTKQVHENRALLEENKILKEKIQREIPYQGDK